MNKDKILKHIRNVFLAGISAVVLFYIMLVFILFLSFGSVHADFYINIVALIVILIELVIIAALWGFLKKKPFYITMLVVLGICIVACFAFFGYQAYVDSIQTVEESGDLLAEYAPYAENSKVYTLDEKSELVITEDFPVMDGATALYPIYSSFAKAVYPKELIENIVTKNGNTTHINRNDILKCNTTRGAYHNIVTGYADIIFAALPSEEQEQFAKENGVELVYTPIGKEAFVFFVNAKNPIDNVTVEDIQKIYSGETTDWSELGIQNLGNIRAFQREEGSGSQSTLEKLMSGKQLMQPPKKDVIADMGGVIEKTADYKNYKNAIGYSFRFYSTKMVSNNQIKLLSVNGVYPETKTIENGTYPIASYFYAVTRSDADENTLKLLDWILGTQGQKIIEKTGYTPLKK